MLIVCMRKCYCHSCRRHLFVHSELTVILLTWIFVLVVFMGSAKYPDENGFDAFLKKHGGSDNASTDCERTIFQFDVQRKYFKEALDRYLICSKSTFGVSMMVICVLIFVR